MPSGERERGHPRHPRLVGEGDERARVLRAEHGDLEDHGGHVGVGERGNVHNSGDRGRVRQHRLPAAAKAGERVEDACRTDGQERRPTAAVVADDVGGQV